LTKVLNKGKKVELKLKDQGRNKTWLAKKLGISRPSLYQRLKDGYWTNYELYKLKELGLL